MGPLPPIALLPAVPLVPPVASAPAEPPPPPAPRPPALRPPALRPPALRPPALRPPALRPPLPVEPAWLPAGAPMMLPPPMTLPPLETVLPPLEEPERPPEPPPAVPTAPVPPELRPALSKNVGKLSSPPQPDMTLMPDAARRNAQNFDLPKKLASQRSAVLHNRVISGSSGFSGDSPSPNRTLKPVSAGECGTVKKDCTLSISR